MKTGLLLIIFQIVSVMAFANNDLESETPELDDRPAATVAQQQPVQQPRPVPIPQPRPQVRPATQAPVPQPAPPRPVQQPVATVTSPRGGAPVDPHPNQPRPVPVPQPQHQPGQQQPRPIPQPAPVAHGPHQGPQQNCAAKHKQAGGELVSLVRTMPHPKLQRLLLQGGMNLMELSGHEQSEMTRIGDQYKGRMQSILAKPNCRTIDSVEAIKSSIRNGNLRAALMLLNNQGGLRGLLRQLDGAIGQDRPVRRGRQPRPVVVHSRYNYDRHWKEHEHQWWWKDICGNPERYNPAICDPLMFGNSAQ